MDFTPAPFNDFSDFFHTYFERCRALIPHIRVIAAKWTFRDLIPGLSDFDTRFVVDDTMTLDDWQAMSLAVGRVHTELAVEVKHWARNLEHLPGINLTLGEITHPLLHYPEFSQWTFYEGDTGIIGRIESTLARRPWSDREEIYHLKKIATYFGPYVRGIDPAVNIGPWENKYPLHSRFMHYFAPPVQAMVSIAKRRTIRGKLDALALARDTLPNPKIIDLIFATLDDHYEIPWLYHDHRLRELERELDQYLQDAWASIATEVSLVSVAPDDTPEMVKQKVGSVPVDPIESFFAHTRFARLMKGRLLFYAQNIAWFDSTWLIRNEIERIVTNFYTKPLATYGTARFAESLNAETVLSRLRGNLLDPKLVDGVRRFVEIAGRPIPQEHERKQALAVADAYDPVLAMIDMLSADMLQFIEGNR